MARIIKATEYTFAGLRAAWVSEAAFRQEAVAAAVLVPVGIYLGQTSAEKALLVSTLLAVVVTELLNSGIEAAVDRIGTEFNPLAKQAKDMGSAAVFISIFMAATVWSIILI